MTVWDIIAPKWHNFRQRPFPKIVEDLAKQWEGKILDVGCGNGRNILAFEGQLHGIDNSKGMLEHAKKLAKKRQKKVSFRFATATKLPYQDKSFDYIICVAMLHHLTLQEQVTALNEIYRVLKPNGKLLLTVWSRWQKRFLFGPIERMVPWRSKNQTIDRYYYLHSPFSFLHIIRKTQFHRISGPNWLDKNLCVILQRKE